MKRIALLVVVSVILCSCGSAEDGPSLDALIQSLGSDDFATREGATQKLKQLGESVAPRLREKLTAITDPETRERINNLLALWPAGGTVWEFEAGYVFGLPVVKDNRVYVGNKDMNVYALEAESGKPLWGTSIGGLIYHSIVAGAVHLSDGTSADRVYAIRTRLDGVKDGTMFCFNAATGAKEWQYKFEPDSQTFCPPMMDDGKVYIGSEDSVFCIDGATGKKDWQFEAPDILVSSISIADGKVLVGCLDGKLYCIDQKTGKKIWEFTTGARVNAGASISGGKAFIGSQDANLYCVSLEGGKELWRFTARGGIPAAPAISGEVLYVGSEEGSFYCLGLDGKKVWEMDTAGSIFSSPGVSGGQVYIGSLNNKLTLFCLEASSGKTLWTFETKEAGYAAPVLAGWRLFVGYHSKFYSLRTGVAGPRNWTMTGGNLQRDGRGQ